MGQQVHHEKKALVNVTKKRALGIVVLAEATAAAQVQMMMRRMAMVETLHAALLRKKTHVLQKEIIAQDLAHHVAPNHLAQGKVKMMIELFLVSVKIVILQCYDLIFNLIFFLSTNILSIKQNRQKYFSIVN